MAKEQPKLTKEQKARQQLIDSIRALTNYKVYTLGQIEKTLGIPKNTLSGMLNGSRNLAPKWERMLGEFLKALPKEDKTITINISPEEHDQEAALEDKLPLLPQQTLTDLVDKGVAITKVLEKGDVTSINPHSEDGLKLVRGAKKTMPSNLTKAQQIRWHRENGQTLL